MENQIPTAEEQIAKAKEIFIKHYAKDLEPPLWMMVYILLHRDYFTLDQTQVAQILGISQGTVSKQYQKAKKKLREQGIPIVD